MICPAEMFVHSAGEIAGDGTTRASFVDAAEAG